MATMKTPNTVKTDQVLLPEESINYVKLNRHTLFPASDTPRKSFGNIPADLHDRMKDFAATNGLKIHEAVAVLFDFLDQYEAEYEQALTHAREKITAR